MDIGVIDKKLGIKRHFAMKQSHPPAERKLSLDAQVINIEDINSTTSRDNEVTLRNNRYMRANQEQKGVIPPWTELFRRTSNPLALLMESNKLDPAMELFGDRDVQLIITFAGAIGVFIGVGVLFSFHAHLVLSGQTTLEFYEAMGLRQRLAREGRQYINAYDQGTKQNFEQVFGKYPWYLAILPGIREPPPVVPPKPYNHSDENEI